jgi:hypothetical protein
MIVPVRLLPALALLAACAVSPEAQLRAGLVKAGLSEPMASCMAQPMAEKLSVEQLRKLRSLARSSDLDVRTASYTQVLREIRALGDPQIVQVTASAALGCALG